MKSIEVNQDGFVVEAEVIAKAFKLAPQDIQPLMRSGEITSLSETGVGEDEGRARLTFHYAGHSMRLVVDQEGTILKSSSFPSRSRVSNVTDTSPDPAKSKNSP